MVTQFLERFSTRVNSEILRSVCEIPQSEGGQLQALVGEVLAELIDKREQRVTAYRGSHDKLVPLYK